MQSKAQLLRQWHKIRHPTWLYKRIMDGINLMGMRFIVAHWHIRRGMRQRKICPIRMSSCRMVHIRRYIRQVWLVCVHRMMRHHQSH